MALSCKTINTLSVARILYVLATSESYYSIVRSLKGEEEDKLRLFTTQRVSAFLFLTFLVVRTDKEKEQWFCQLTFFLIKDF